MRISDWSSDVCSSDLIYDVLQTRVLYSGNLNGQAGIPMHDSFTDNSFNNWKWEGPGNYVEGNVSASTGSMFEAFWLANYRGIVRSNEAIVNLEKMSSDQINDAARDNFRSEEHKSELQSIKHRWYDVFCLK